MINFVLAVILMLLWLFGYLKYTIEASQSLKSLYSKIFHVFVAGLAGWAIGDLLTRLF